MDAHRHTPGLLLLVAAVWLGVVGATTASQPAGSVFALPSDRVGRIVATVPDVDEPPERASGDSPMLLRLRGVLSEVGGRDYSAVVSSAPATPRPMMPRGEPAVIARLHLLGRATQRTVDVYRCEDGSIVAGAASIDAPAPPGPDPWQIAPITEFQRLDSESFERGSSTWPRYLGSLEPESARLVGIERPYLAGRFTMDEATIRARIGGGKRVNAEPASRALGREAFHVRVPKGYDPRFPAGVLVWISPDDGGEPPAVLTAAADRLGLVLAGAERSGNNRSPAERFQLVFDVVATVERDLHIDPRRVYVGGLSGGGRVASILWACFPDVFAGALPVVGISSYHTVPNGHGTTWPPAYSRPSGAIGAALRTRRMAAVSGPGDFNYREVSVKAQLMVDDGLNVRLFQDPQMGHSMPRESLIAEALEWIDVPYRDERAREERAAERSLAKAGAIDPARGPTPRQRSELIEATRAGAWSHAAWKAVELLRMNSGDPDSTPAVRE